MSSGKSRHTCQYCKKKRYVERMRMINAKSDKNGKPEWACLTCSDPAGTYRLIKVPAAKVVPERANDNIQEPKLPPIVDHEPLSPAAAAKLKELISKPEPNDNPAIADSDRLRYISGGLYMIGCNALRRVRMDWLLPGEPVTSIGKLTANGKQSSSCRRTAFPDGMTYSGQTYIERDGRISPCALFEVPKEVITGTELDEPLYKVFIIISADGQDEFVVPTEDLGIRIHKALINDTPINPFATTPIRHYNRGRHYLYFVADGDIQREAIAWGDGQLVPGQKLPYLGNGKARTTLNIGQEVEYVGIYQQGVLCFALFSCEDEGKPYYIAPGYVDHEVMMMPNSGNTFWDIRAFDSKQTTREKKKAKDNLPGQKKQGLAALTDGLPGTFTKMKTEPEPVCEFCKEPGELFAGTCDTCRAEMTDEEPRVSVLIRAAGPYKEVDGELILSGKGMCSLTMLEKFYDQEKIDHFVSISKPARKYDRREYGFIAYLKNTQILIYKSESNDKIYFFGKDEQWTLGSPSQFKTAIEVAAMYMDDIEYLLHNTIR